jgi:hypothetical protein
MKICTEVVKLLQVHRHAYIAKMIATFFANFHYERSKSLTRFIRNIPRHRFQRPSAFRAWNVRSCRTQLSLTLQAHTTALDSTTVEWRTYSEQSFEDSVSSTSFLNTACCVYSPPDKTLGLPRPVCLSGLVALRNT